MRLVENLGEDEDLVSIDLEENPLSKKRNYLFHHICFPRYKCIIASRDVSVRRGMTKLDISNVQEDSIPEMTSIDCIYFHVYVTLDRIIFAIS